MDRQYYIYVLSNYLNTVLYIGITNNLQRRAWEHMQESNPGFTKKYHLQKLVYYEIYEDANSAITREKQIKAGNRKKKIDIINSFNPDWKDLYSTIL